MLINSFNFVYLIFQVSVHRDLSSKKIMKTVLDFSKEDNSQSEMSVVVVMSHGDDGIIFGSDEGKVKNEDLLIMFNNKNAWQLIGKPKLFIFAHCR
jgi:hypothetical protein